MFDEPSPTALESRVAALEALVVQIGGSIESNAAGAGDAIEALSVQRAQGDAAALAQIVIEAAARLANFQAVDDRIGDEILRADGKERQLDGRIDLLGLRQEAMVDELLVAAAAVAAGVGEETRLEVLAQLAPIQGEIMAAQASASASAMQAALLLAFIQALANGGPYASVQAAIDSGNVANGANFAVTSGDYLLLYRRNGSTGDATGFKIASATLFAAMKIALDRATEQLAELGVNLATMKGWTGDGDILPDKTTRVGIYDYIAHGWRRSDFARMHYAPVDGPGFVKSVIRELLKYHESWSFVGDGPIWPWLMLGDQATVYFDETVGRMVIHDVLVRGDHGLETGGGGSGPVRGPSSRLDASEGYNAMIYYGQSLSVGAAAQPAITLAQPYSNVTFIGGVKSIAPADQTGFKPLVEDNRNELNANAGDRGETLCSAAANYAVELAARTDGIDPADFVIFASTAGKGGTNFAGLKKGTPQYNYLLGQVTQGKAVATAEGKAFVVHKITVLHGESDDDAGQSAAGYAADLIEFTNDINADVRAITGQTKDVQILIDQPSWNAAAAGDVQLGQFQAARQHPLIHLITPTFIFDQAGPGPHLVNSGYNHMARYFGRAAKQIIVEGRDPDLVDPISAIAVGTKLRVNFKVPKAPLVLDTALMRPANQFGFRLADDSGDVALSNGAVVGGTAVQFTLARSLGANPRIRLGLDYLGAGMTLTGGGSHNLRDSTDDPVTVNGMVRPLWHVAPHFEIPIIKLVE